MKLWPLVTPRGDSNTTATVSVLNLDWAMPCRLAIVSYKHLGFFSCPASPSSCFLSGSKTRMVPNRLLHVTRYVSRLSGVFDMVVTSDPDEERAVQFYEERAVQFYEQLKILCTMLSAASCCAECSLQADRSTLNALVMRADATLQNMARCRNSNYAVVLPILRMPRVSGLHHRDALL